MHKVVALRIHADHQRYIGQKVEEALEEMKAYFQSEKFWRDQGTSVHDVLARLADVETARVDAMIEPFGMACDLKAVHALGDPTQLEHTATDSCVKAHHRLERAS